MLLQEAEEKKGKERAAAERETSSTSSTSTSSNSPSSSAAAAALVRDFALLLSAVRHQRDLLLSHGIGVDRDARQMETIRRTAARVGLRLPEEAKEAREE